MLIWWKRIVLLAWFAVTRPGVVIGVPWRAINANLAILRRRRGRRVWLVSLESTVYLPFIESVLQAMPDETWRRVMLVVACRSFAAADVKRELAHRGIAVDLVVDNWTCGLILFYDLFLATHQSAVPPLIKRGERVCSFHGLPAKGGTFVESQWRFFDGAFLIGPLQRRMFDDFRERTGQRERLTGYEVGLTKSDAMLDGRLQRHAERAELRFSEERPVVFYAPTWEAGASLRTRGMEIIERLCSGPWNVVVKLHPMSYYPCAEQAATGGIDWRAALARFESLDNFRHLPDADGARLLIAADAVVSDVSSIAFEAMLIDRPVVFVDCPKFFESTVRTMYGLTADEARRDLRYNCGREAGVVVDSLDDLMQAVECVLRDPAQQADARRRIREQLVFNPGRASQVAAQTIQSLLGIARRTE